jgi:DNA-binding MarR family transcriptional regulator
MTTDPSVQQPVDQSVGYLLSRARSKLAKALDVALDEYGITHAQGGIILMLSSGRYPTAADMARELYIDSASMTRMIDRLEKRGLLYRVRCDDDRRVVSLRLTQVGERMADRLPAIFADVRGRCFSSFNPEEVATLKSLLRKFLDADGASDEPGAD